MAISTHSQTTRLLLFGSISMVSVIAMCGILLGINYLSFRHFWRKDLTRNQTYTISDKSLAIMSNLNGDIDIYVFFPPSSRLFPYIKTTLDNLSIASKKITVSYINIDRDILKAQELKQRFKLIDEQSIVVSHSEKFQVITLQDIADIDIQNAVYGMEPRIKAFKGEQALVSAILSVTSKEQTNIYFTTGHGELDISDSTSEHGGAEAVSILKQNTYGVFPLILSDKESIPADTHLLIVAGAKKTFTAHEVALIRKYLKSGKPLLLLSDPQTVSGLESLMDNNGIKIGNDVVVDPTQFVPFSNPSYLIANVIPTHMITKPLKDMVGTFLIARSVLPIQSNQLNTVTPLVQTTPSGWAESTPDAEPLTKDPDNDLVGPVSIAVACEPDNTSYGRCVVFGDSDFISNSQINTLANKDLYENSINWLLQKDTYISVAPKVFEQKTINMTNKSLEGLREIILILIPIISFMVGIAVWRIRKKNR